MTDAVAAFWLQSLTGEPHLPAKAHARQPRGAVHVNAPDDDEEVDFVPDTPAVRRARWIAALKPQPIANANAVPLSQAAGVRVTFPKDTKC